jgi:hypothetical protein
MSETKFKELYTKSLGQFDHEADGLESSCSLTKDFLSSTHDSMVDILKESCDEDTGTARGKRSVLYQKLLYELDPSNIIEVFFMGHMLGALEIQNKFQNQKDNGELGDLSGTQIKLLKLASDVSIGSIKMADTRKACVELAENFHNLLEQTLFKMIKEDSKDEDKEE